MRTPLSLKAGNKIALVATARKVTREEMQPAIEVIRSWGFEVVETSSLYAEENQYAGNDAQRASAFQKALDDEDIHAILCARGGYGSVRIIDSIDFSAFVKSPKWIIGYSDITVFHAHIQQQFNIETLHAVMPLDFKTTNENQPGAATLHKALTGEPLSYTVEQHSLNRPGEATAELVGGNLSILYSLTGTRSSIDTRGKILFIEDLDEYLYHIDRMMMNLKRADMLSGLKGLVIGGMTDMNDNTIPFGKDAETIILEAVKEYDFPVCFGFPAGHLAEQRTLIMGRKTTLKVDADSTELLFHTPQ